MSRDGSNTSTVSVRHGARILITVFALMLAAGANFAPSFDSISTNSVLKQSASYIAPALSYAVGRALCIGAVIDGEVCLSDAKAWQESSEILACKVGGGRISCVSPALLAVILAPTVLAAMLLLHNLTYQRPLSLRGGEKRPRIALSLVGLGCSSLMLVKLILTEMGSWGNFATQIPLQECIDAADACGLGATATIGQIVFSGVFLLWAIVLLAVHLTAIAMNPVSSGKVLKRVASLIRRRQ